MTSAATPATERGEQRRVRSAILEIADLSIEEIGGLLVESGPRPRLEGTYLIDIPPAEEHVRHAVEHAIDQAGGRVLVSDWPSLWTDRANPMGAGLRPPLRAAVIGAEHHEVLERYSRQSRVPIVNAGTDRHSPLRVLADLLTVRDLVGHLRTTSIAFVGPPCGYRTSLIQAASRLGMQLTVCTRHPDSGLLAVLEAERPYAQLFGGQLHLTDPARSAVEVSVLIGDPASFGLLATLTHLPLPWTGVAAGAGDSVSEGPRSLLFHRQENLELIVRRLMALSVEHDPATLTDR